MAVRRFTNLDPSVGPDFRKTLKWAMLDRIRGRRRKSPNKAPIPVVDRVDIEVVGERAFWLGHATALLSMGGLWILTDPVFATRLGGVIPRNAPVLLSPDDLPGLDLVLISHNHRDHLDKATVRALEARYKPRYVVPVGVERYLKSWKIAPERIQSLEWWGSVQPAPDRSDLRVSFVPSQHWSSRGIPGDINTSLWGGYVLSVDGRKVYFAGDSGWFDGFEEIGRRHPGINLALIPIGAYDPQWFMSPQHMNPEEAGKTFLTLGAERMISIHWGTYKLTDEPLDEPPARLEDWRSAQKVDASRILTLPVGGGVDLG